MMAARGWRLAWHSPFSADRTPSKRQRPLHLLHPLTKPVRQHLPAKLQNQSLSICSPASPIVSLENFGSRRAILSSHVGKCTYSHPDTSSVPTQQTAPLVAASVTRAAVCALSALHRMSNGAPTT